MLCKECDEFRFPRFMTKSTATSDTKSDTTVFSHGSASSSGTGDVQAAADDDDNQVQDQLHEQHSPARLLIVNELLFFVINKFDRQPRSSIQSAAADFYRLDEIVAAKQLLLSHVDVLQHQAIQPYTKTRIGKNKVDRTVHDIVNIVGFLDENDIRDTLPVFCAANLSRIPILPDDKCDIWQPYAMS